MYQIKAPNLLNEDSFESIVSQLPSSPGSITELSIDLSSIDFIDPYGMIGIIELGEYLKSQGIKLNLMQKNFKNSPLDKIQITWYSSIEHVEGVTKCPIISIYSNLEISLNKN